MFLLWLTMVGWLAPGSPQAPDAGEDVIVWSAARKLDWKDFKAKPEGGALGGARIAISHNYSIGCRDGVLQARVQAVMVPAKSWVTYRILSSGLASRVGLRHEQVHFDQAELYARRVRKLLRELTEPCSRTDAELNEMAERVFKEHWTAQGRYEVATRNGELEAKQNEWEKRIASELAALAAFADRGSASSSLKYGAAAEVRSCRTGTELTLKFKFF